MTLIYDELTRLNKAFKRKYNRDIKIRVEEMPADMVGKALGYASYFKEAIIIDAELYYENKERYVEHVVAHEACHLYTMNLYGYGVRAHGKQFKRVVNRLQLPKSVGMAKTREFNHSEVLMKRYAKTHPFQWECKACKVILQLNTREHKVTTLRAAYRCAECKGPITFIEKVNSSSTLSSL